MSATFELKLKTTNAFPGTVYADRKLTAIAPLLSGVGQRPGSWAAPVQGTGYRYSFGLITSP